MNNKNSALKHDIPHTTQRFLGSGSNSKAKLVESNSSQRYSGQTILLNVFNIATSLGYSC